MGKNLGRKVSIALVGLSLVIAGCEPLYREVEPFWEADVGGADVWEEEGQEEGDDEQEEEVEEEEEQEEEVEEEEEIPEWEETTLETLVCPGVLELFWESMEGARRYEVQWDDGSGSWTGGGVTALNGSSGMRVEADFGERLALFFGGSFEGIFFRVRGYSGTTLLGESETMEVSLPLGERGSVTDTADALIVPAGSIYTTSGRVERGVEIRIEGTLCVAAHQGGEGGILELAAPAVEVGGSISATGKGHSGGNATCQGPPSTGGGGGSYGGRGENLCGAGGAPYGDESSRSIEIGSGGGGTQAGEGPGGGGTACGSRSQAGGAGGGAILLEGSETVSVSGIVVANGAAPSGDCSSGGGAGSGGGILLDGSSVTIESTARIVAAGGVGSQPGGGGRIKIFGLSAGSGEGLFSVSAGGEGAEDGTIYVE